MKALLAPALASLLSACASAPPPPGTQVSAGLAARTILPGQSTRASLHAALGATRTIALDSGAEVWLYQVPAAGGRFSELVVLVGPDGVVRRTRLRAPDPLPLK